MSPWFWFRFVLILAGLGLYVFGHGVKAGGLVFLVGWALAIVIAAGILIAAVSRLLRRW